MWPDHARILRPVRQSAGAALIKLGCRIMAWGAEIACLVMKLGGRFIGWGHEWTR